MILDFGNCDTKFESTIPGKRLRDAIDMEIRDGNISLELGNIVFTNAARNYCSYFDDPKINPNNEMRILLEELPVIFSLLDIITFSLPVMKSIILVSKFNSSEIVKIFKLKNEKFTKIDWVFNDNEISIFVHIETLRKARGEKLYSHIAGREIFQEIEARKIKVGFYEHYLDELPKSKYGAIWFNGVRRLGITNKLVGYSSGYRDDIRHGFRSAWEANFARILNYLEIPWAFEKDSFPLGSDHFIGYYFPDFFLPNNVIVEIKGFWDNASREKVTLFKKNYPEYELVLIDSDLYFDLDKKFSSILPNWEDLEIRIPENQIQIVGITRPERIKVVESLRIDDELFLSRDKENNYDNNAIQVLTNSRQLVGFVARDWASILAQKMDCGVEYSAKIREINQKVIQLIVRRTNVDKEIMPPIPGFS